MTPKEKAQEIFYEMYYVDDPMGKYPMCFDTAKQCAWIMSVECLRICSSEDVEYWLQVKQEIEAL